MGATSGLDPADNPLLCPVVRGTTLAMSAARSPITMPRRALVGYLSLALITISAALWARPSDQASGAVVVDTAAIATTHAVGYRVRDQRNARRVQTEILLSDVAIDATPVRASLDPHLTAINLEALKDHNYVLLWVSADGSVVMNATFSKTMTQYINDTSGGLRVAWTSNTASRLEGRLTSNGMLKTMDGTPYTVDVRFAVDIPADPPSQPLGAGGGEAGKVFTTFLTAALKKNWSAIQTGSSPEALRMFDRSYNTPAENAESAAEMLRIWLPVSKMKVTGGQLRGDVAILEVEGEMFPGQKGLSLVQMVRAGTSWQFDRVARAGSVP